MKKARTTIEQSFVRIKEPFVKERGTKELPEETAKFAKHQLPKNPYGPDYLNKPNALISGVCFESREVSANLRKVKNALLQVTTYLWKHAFSEQERKDILESKNLPRFSYPLDELVERAGFKQEKSDYIKFRQAVELLSSRPVQWKEVCTDDVIFWGSTLLADKGYSRKGRFVWYWNYGVLSTIHDAMTGNFTKLDMSMLAGIDSGNTIALLEYAYQYKNFPKRTSPSIPVGELIDVVSGSGAYMRNGEYLYPKFKDSVLKKCLSEVVESVMIPYRIQISELVGRYGRITDVQLSLIDKDPIDIENATLAHTLTTNQKTKLAKVLTDRGIANRQVEAIFDYCRSIEYFNAQIRHFDDSNNRVPGVLFNFFREDGAGFFKRQKQTEDALAKSALEREAFNQESAELERKKLESRKLAKWLLEMDISDRRNLVETFFASQDSGYLRESMEKANWEPTKVAGFMPVFRVWAVQDEYICEQAGI